MTGERADCFNTAEDVGRNLGLSGCDRALLPLFARTFVGWPVIVEALGEEAALRAVEQGWIHCRSEDRPGGS
ncbi:MAG: hypothetical protein R3D98_03155 [Candidatus Krumholzibacteriia bacterium]